MLCECLPEVMLVEFPNVTNANLIIQNGDAVFPIGLNLSTFVANNPSFLITKNENGQDRLYAMKTSDSVITINIQGTTLPITGVITPWSEVIAIHLFGGRPKPTK